MIENYNVICNISNSMDHEDINIIYGTTNTCSNNEN